jgi:bacterioferritin-associated ferredoxin
MAMVCLCYGVNERRVRREIDHGATTIEEIAERCKAGSCCLSCHPTLDDLLAERTPAERTPAVAVVPRRRRFLIA